MFIGQDHKSILVFHNICSLWSIHPRRSASFIFPIEERAEIYLGHLRNVI